MSRIPALVRRELAAYFVSPIAYVVLAVFLVLAGVDFAFGYLSAETGQFRPGAVRHVLNDMGFLLLLLTPLLTMRLLSEEFNSGTIETLMTAPVSNPAVVFAKFLGAVGFFLVMILPTLAFPAIHFLSAVEIQPDPGPVISGYFGLLLLGMATVAVGTFTSACARNQISAALASVLILGLLWIAGEATVGRASGWLGRSVQYLGILYHFKRFTKGLIDTTGAVYYLSVTALFLLAAIGVIAVRRWR